MVVWASAGRGGQHSVGAVGPARSDEAAAPRPEAAALGAAARDPLSQVGTAAAGQCALLPCSACSLFFILFFARRPLAGSLAFYFIFVARRPLTRWFAPFLFVLFFDDVHEKSRVTVMIGMSVQSRDCLPTVRDKTCLSVHESVHGNCSFV